MNICFYARCLFTNIQEITLTQQETESADQTASIISLPRLKASRDDVLVLESTLSKFKKISEMMGSTGASAKQSIWPQQSVHETRGVEGEWNHQPLNVAVGVQCRIGEKIDLKVQVLLLARLSNKPSPR